MSWLRIDDHMMHHWKIAPISDAAFRLHVTAMAWCAGSRTDGRVPKSIVATLTRAPSGDAMASVLAELCTPGQSPDGEEHAPLWEDRGTYYEIHDYLEYNISTEAYNAKRNAGRLGGKSKASKRLAPASDVLEQTASKCSSKTLADPDPDPDQIQPDHTHSRPDTSPARDPEPEAAAPPAASQRERPRDRFAESFAGPSQAAIDLFEAWKTSAEKPNAAFDARRRELFERLVLEGVTEATVRDAVAGAKLDDWARGRALSPAIVLGSAEQREKYIALAKAPRTPRGGRGGPPQPNDPNPSTRWRPSQVYGPGHSATPSSGAASKPPTPTRGAAQDSVSTRPPLRTTPSQPNPPQNARDPGGLILRPLASTMSLRAFSLSAGGLDG